MHGRVCSKEEVVVNATNPCAIEILGAEVLACDQWHVAAITVGLALGGIVEGGDSVSADTTQ